MNPVSISLIAFGCIFGGTLLGMYLRTALPEHHLNDESKDVVKLGTGMIAMMAALVLGLLIASAKSSFDTMNSGLVQAGSKTILLDRVMADYGPETREARDLLRRGLTTAIEQVSLFDKTGLVTANQSESRLAFEISRLNCSTCPRRTKASGGSNHGL